MKNLTLRTTESAGKREIRYFKKRRINSIAQNPKLIMPSLILCFANEVAIKADSENDTFTR